MFFYKNVNASFLFLRQLFVLVILCTGSGVWSQVHVGNGGEGVVVEGRVFSRDLVEAKLEQDFWIGDRSPEFFRNSNEADLKPSLEILQKLGISAPLFLRKLGDISQIDQRLAVALWLGLNSFDWNLNRDKLGQIYDDSPAPRWFDAQRVQVAVRFLKSIQISEPAWLLMDQPQRIALVLHELIYAFQFSECDSNDICSQSPGQTREFVAALFHPATYSQLEQLEEGLNSTRVTQLKKSLGQFLDLSEPSQETDSRLLSAFEVVYLEYPSRFDVQLRLGLRLKP